MIAFKDFVPEKTSAGGVFRRSEFEPFDQAVAHANLWISQQTIDVINVETVALPNIHSSREEGSNDASLTIYDGSTWHQFVRVWYRQ